MGGGPPLFLVSPEFMPGGAPEGGLAGLISGGPLRDNPGGGAPRGGAEPRPGGGPGGGRAVISE